MRFPRRSGGEVPRRVLVQCRSVTLGYQQGDEYALHVPGSERRRGSEAGRLGLVLHGGAAGGAAAPTIHPFGAAWAGNNRYALSVEGAPPNAKVAFVVGQRAASVMFAGVEVSVDLGRPHIVVTLTANAAGKATLDLPIPSNAPTAEIFAQGLVFDASGPLGLTGTRGMRFNLFRR